MATITSMSYLFRSVGGVVGVSLTSAIFQAVVKNVLVKKITGPNADIVSLFFPLTLYLQMKLIILSIVH